MNRAVFTVMLFVVMAVVWIVVEVLEKMGTQ